MPVAQACQDPASHHQHGVLDLGLVVRVRGAGGQLRAALDGGEIVVRGAGFGVVAVGAFDQGERLVGNDQPGRAAEELLGPDLRADPVGHGRVAQA